MKTKIKSSKKKNARNTPDPKSSTRRTTIESRDLNEDEQQRVTNVERHAISQDNSSQESKSEDDDDRTVNRLNTTVEPEEDHERIIGEGDQIEDNKNVKE